MSLQHKKPLFKIAQAHLCLLAFFIAFRCQFAIASGSFVPAFVDPRIYTEDSLSSDTFRTYIRQDPYFSHRLNHFIENYYKPYQLFREPVFKEKAKIPRRGFEVETIEDRNFVFEGSWINDSQFSIKVKGTVKVSGYHAVEDLLSRYETRKRVRTTTQHPDRILPRFTEACANRAAEFETHLCRESGGVVRESHHRLDGHRHSYNNEDAWFQRWYEQDCFISVVIANDQKCAAYVSLPGCLNEPFHFDVDVSFNYALCERKLDFPDISHMNQSAWNCKSEYKESGASPTRDEQLSRFELLLTDLDKKSGRYNLSSKSGYVIQSSLFFPSFRQWHTFDDKIKTAEYIIPQAIQINGREIDLASEFIAMIEGRKQYNNLSSISITPHLKFKLDWSSDKLCWPNQLINNKIMITANDQIIGSISPGNRQYFFPLVGEHNSPAWDVILRDGSLVLRSQVKIVDQSELFVPASQRIPTVCKLAITDAAIVFPKDTVEPHIAHVTEVARHVMNEAQISYNLPVALLTIMQRLEGVYMRLSGGEKRQETEAIETTAAADESTEEESCKATDAIRSECVAKTEKPNDTRTKKDMHVVSLNLQKEQKFLTQFNSLQSSPAVARLYRMGLSHHITNAVEMTDRFLNDFSQLQAQRITLSYMLNPQIQFTNKLEESEDIFQQDQWLFLTTSREL